MSSDDGHEPAGLGRRLRSLLGGVLDIVETRLELLGTDVELQAVRLRTMAVLLLAGMFFVALALVFVSLLAIAAFWETHRLLAVASVAAIHLAAGVGCLLGLRHHLRAGPRPFDATLAEIRQDLSRLR